MMHELTISNLSRHYHPGELAAYIDEDADKAFKRQTEVMEHVRSLDSGRLHTMLTAQHRHLSAMDSAGRDHALSLLSEEGIAWLNLYAKVEGLIQFGPEAAWY